MSASAPGSDEMSRLSVGGAISGIVEVFAGVGSVAAGFEKVTPIRTAYLCDNDEVCRETFILNGGDEAIFEVADVRVPRVRAGSSLVYRAVNGRSRGGDAHRRPTTLTPYTPDIEVPPPTWAFVEGAGGVNCGISIRVPDLRAPTTGPRDTAAGMVMACQLVDLRSPEVTDEFRGLTGERLPVVGRTSAAAAVLSEAAGADLICLRPIEPRTRRRQTCASWCREPKSRRAAGTVGEELLAACRRAERPRPQPDLEACPLARDCVAQGPPLVPRDTAAHGHQRATRCPSVEHEPILTMGHESA